MSLFSICKAHQPKVHASEYIRTNNAEDEDKKPEESTQPESPKAD